MGAWEEIVDYTVPISTSTVTLTNFGTITKDDFIKVVSTFKSENSSSAAYYNLFANTDTTNSNYWRQELQGLGSNVSATRLNFPNIGVTVNNLFTTIITYLKISENDKANTFSNGNFDNAGSNVRVMFEYTTSTSNHSTITSLVFNGTDNFGSVLSNSIAAGSRIQIYRLAAEKVADIVVSSNTTQVDITGLDITKDNEYLLISDLLSSAGPQRVSIFPNNDINESNYYYQSIEGDGSSALAFRENVARLLPLEDGQSTLTYSHIKLSNIGAFTVQSYSIRNTGSSSLRLENAFLSSIAENLTNVSQLSFRHANTNGIGNTSRFQLYKLY
jgi:hypothetical protein